MKPAALKTKIFLDGGDPAETREIISLLGWLDGQTTNPTLIAHNPEAEARLAKGEKYTKSEVLDFYRSVVQEISGLIPRGSVSVEVYADGTTETAAMVEEGRMMDSWIANAHIKYPMTRAGLAAAQIMVKEGHRVNMTLCFSQAQAAAVYAATRGAVPGQVFISPFVGRFDDRGDKGMDIIQNIVTMYEAGDRHVQVLAASIRSMDHFMASLNLGADIITAPFKVLRAWAEAGLPLPPSDYVYDGSLLRPIPYQPIDLQAEWPTFDLRHDLTDKGVERFAHDWNQLIGPVGSSG